MTETLYRWDLLRWRCHIIIQTAFLISERVLCGFLSVYELILLDVMVEERVGAVRPAAWRNHNIVFAEVNLIAESRLNYWSIGGNEVGLVLHLRKLG